MENNENQHPNLGKEIFESVICEDVVSIFYNSAISFLNSMLIFTRSGEKERTRNINERKIYLQLYEAMEALIRG